MIDINLIREDTERVVENLKRRGDFDINLIYEIKNLDNQWRSLKTKIDGKRAEKNVESLRINELKKQGESIDAQVKLVKRLNQKLAECESQINEVKALLEEKLLLVPNLLADDVPYGVDDQDNVPVKFFLEKPVFDFEVRDHIDIVELNDLVDVENASRVSGSRFYFLKNELVELNFALLSFVRDKLRAKGFDVFITPEMARAKGFEGTGFLPQGKDDLYKIEGEDLFLIGTSEVVLASRLANKVVERKDLPVKNVGISHCFRTEAGSHGRDEKGIFRVHQFEKMEMFVFCEPEQSFKMQEEMIEIAQEVFRELSIHYRIVNICTGDLGHVATKKYDLEAWLPGQGKYREMVSCSNCLDYQTRRLNIKFRNDDNKLEFLHSLNSTTIANTRALIAIMENHQTKDGNVRIPEVLQRYLGRELLIDDESCEF